MNAIEKALRNLERGVLSVVKETLQRYPQEVSIFINEFRRDPSDKEGLRKSKKTGNLYYDAPNKTKRLRTLYGNITRATTVGGKGNTSTVTLEGGRVIAQFGYDADTAVKAGTRSITLEYAKHNEKKRPFMIPGFKKFMTDPIGYKALMTELETSIIDLTR